MPKPTSVYPAAVVDDSRLTIAANRLLTKLTLSITATDTTMTVQDASRIEANALLTLDSEIVRVTAVPTGNIVPIQRAFDGSTATAHVVGGAVSGFVDAWHHNALSSEVQAIEQALGPNLSNISSVIFNAGQFDFPAQTPGGNLAAGLNVINLSPVPRGVSGTNTKHYLYISGGTGAAEAVLISGGTAVSGGASGTVIVNCANAHTGSWTIRSATSGIQETEKSLPAAGGVVSIGPGNFTIYAPISYQRHRTFQGAGSATRLVPATNSLVVFNSNIPVHPTSAYEITSDNIRFADFVIDGHTMATNSITGVQHLAQSPAELYSIWDVRFDRVHFNNIRYAVHMQRVLDVKFFGCFTYANSEIRFDDTAVDPTTHNHFIWFDQFEYSWNTMDGDVAHPTLAGVGAITVINGEVVYFINCMLNGSGGMSGMDGIQILGGTEGLVICSCSTINMRYGLFLDGLLHTDGRYYFPGYLHILNFGCDQIWAAGMMASDGRGTQPYENVHNVEIVNCNFTNPHPSSTGVTMLRVGKYSNRWAITNAHMGSLTTSFPQTGLSIGANSRAVTLNNLQLFNESGDSGGIGVFIESPAGVYGLETCLFEGITTKIIDNGAGMATVASAATVTLPQGRKTVAVTGSVNITAITAPEARQVTNRVTLIFVNGGLTVASGGSLKLAGNLVATANSTLTLEYVLTAGFWYEVSRSVAA